MSEFDFDSFLKQAVEEESKFDDSKNAMEELHQNSKKTLQESKKTAESNAVEELLNVEKDIQEGYNEPTATEEPQIEDIIEDTQEYVEPVVEPEPLINLEKEEEEAGSIEYEAEETQTEPPEPELTPEEKEIQEAKNRLNSGEILDAETIILATKGAKETVLKHDGERVYNKKTELPQDTKVTRCWDELFETFTDEQKAYVTSIPKEQRVAQPEIDLHFNQLQDPYSVSNNQQLNKALEEERKAEEERLAKEEEARKEREEYERLHANSKIEDLDETPEEARARNKRIKKATRTKERKIPDKYPKTYFDPTDMEIDENDGKEYYYFNIEKTLRKYNLLGITKVIPLYRLDWMNDTAFFDGVAARQHEKTLKLNAMEAEDQYDRDIRYLFIKIATGVAAVAAITCYIVFSVIPTSKFKDATLLMNNKQYETAYHGFTELGQYNDAFVYAKYCEGQVFFKKEMYDEAKDCFTKLVPYQHLFDAEKINFETLVTECDYQKALTCYSNNDYVSAKALFRSVYKHKDATEYYYKSCYAIADDYYNKGDYYQAIDNFYSIATMEYSDSKTRLSDIAAQIYEEAQGKYGRAEYDKAAVDFEFLKNYNYKDSAEMISQCYYRNGINSFNANDFETARKYFEKNRTYKDSFALEKQCIYNIANATFAKDAVNSIAYYEQVKGFKSATDILNSNELSLFGRWNIIEMDGNTITPIEFSFYANGLFKTNQQILSTAISTDATPYSYVWKTDHYETKVMDNVYTITTKSYDDANNQITIICADANNSHEYVCKRVYKYTDMLIADKTVVNEEDNTELTLNQKIEREISAYVDKKIDGYVTINGEEVEVNGLKTKLQDALEQDIAGEGTSEAASVIEDEAPPAE